MNRCATLSALFCGLALAFAAGAQDAAYPNKPIRMSKVVRATGMRLD